MSTIKVTITRPVSGAFSLAYHEGESCELPSEQAKELMDKGYAKPFVDETEETAPAVETATTEKPLAETATAGPKKKAK